MSLNSFSWTAFIGIEIDASNKSLWSALSACQEAFEADKKTRFAVAAKDRIKEDERLKRIDLAKAAALAEKIEKEKEKTKLDAEAKLNGFLSEIATSTSTDCPSSSTASNTSAESKVDNDEDLLSGFFSDVQGKEATEPVFVKDETFMHEKYTNEDLGDKKKQYERIMAKNYEWRNLNPYFVLQLGIDATEEDIKQRWWWVQLLYLCEKRIENYSLFWVCCHEWVVIIDVAN